MNINIANKLDKILFNSALLYIFIPIEIFFIGFLKWYLAVGLTIVMIYSFVKISENVEYRKIEIKNKKKIVFFILIIFIWVIFSGIGGFSYQNRDYIVRNPIFNDLINNDWPVYYNFENASKEIKDIVGNNEVGFSYYFTFWLPAALVGKIMGNIIAQIFLIIWSIIGILLVIYLIKRITKAKLLLIILGMIFFSGMDSIGFFCTQQSLKIGEHLEWWAILFQYSSITTCLYWVFNQSIPTWIITSLILNLNNNKSALAIGSLTFAYSPFAIFGIIPIMIVATLKKYEKKAKKFIIKIKDATTFQNIVIPIIIIIVYGSFYISNANKMTTNGWIFSRISTFRDAIIFACLYITFVVLEFGVYSIIIYKERRKSVFFVTAIVSLILIPFYVMTEANDFAMRASIPAIFILMIEILYFLRDSKNKKNRIILIILLIIGMITPINEIYRSMKNTVNQTNQIRKDMSLGNGYEKINYLKLYDKQFFVHNYNETFFFKYLAK